MIVVVLVLLRPVERGSSDNLRSGHSQDVRLLETGLSISSKRSSGGYA
jgi:hypothetical protein